MHRHLLAAGLAATLGMAAVAQTQGPAAGTQASQPQAQRERAPADPARMEQRRARMEKRMEHRLGKLKEQLALTPAQEGAWTAWSTAVKPDAGLQRPSREEVASLTTPERIDRMRAYRAQRQAEMDKRLDATKTFYAALTPEQQKTFDARSQRLLRGHGGRGGWMGHHHG
jgi:Spy/CpxP family protein refolding chaperone